MMKKMPGVGLSKMDYILRALFIFCLGFTSHATFTDSMTSRLPRSGGDYTTTLNTAAHEVITSSNEEIFTTSASSVKESKDEDSLLTTNAEGVVSQMTDIITMDQKQSSRLVVNETSDTQSNSTSSLPTTGVLTTSSEEGGDIYAENSIEMNTQTTEVFSPSTMSHRAVTFTHGLSMLAKTTMPTVETSSSKIVSTTKSSTSAEFHEKVTEPSQKIPPTVTFQKVDNVHTKNRFDIDGPIGEDLEKDFNKPISELSGHTKGFAEQTYYEQSPEYLQRQTINHAAIWITVGFVAILLTYILALFIHEKGRYEWRMATQQDYSRFENESDTNGDDSSITIDLDSSSATPSTSATDKAQEMTMVPQVVDTTRSH